LENPTKGAPTATKAVVVTDAAPAATEATVEATTAGTTAVTEAAATTPGVIPTLTKPATYTLQKGEWPICIARRFDVDHTELLTDNNLAMNTTPAEGTVLKIPATGSWSYGDRARFEHPTTYTVKADDTVYTVACYFGDVSPEAIIAANSLTTPYTLTAGQTLKIP
jgi:LysM repeat protein